MSTPRRHRDGRDPRAAALLSAAIAAGIVLDVVLGTYLGLAAVWSRWSRTRMAGGHGNVWAVVWAALLTVTVPLLVTLPSRVGNDTQGHRGTGLFHWAASALPIFVAVVVLAHRLRARQAPERWETAPPDGRRPATAVVAGVLAALAGTTAVVATRTSSGLLLFYWTFGVAVISACFVAFLVGRRYTHLPVARGRVLCIVPVYNEPAATLSRTVDALLAQSVPVDVIVIDDGSDTPVIPTRSHDRLRWWRHANTGKRGAQVAVLRQIDRTAYDFVMTVDSDSAPHPDACEQLLRAMSNPRIQAATGMIYVRNHRDSWVSMAADIDIGSSCVMMRASRSMLGALETTSGALALYRSEILFDHLDAYAVECGTGDDRWLTLRALRRGEVVAVAEAGVETDMPDTLSGTFRQRLRWARSWWWMLPYVFRHLGPQQMASPLLGLVQMAVGPLMLGVAISAFLGLSLPAGAGASYVVMVYVGAYLAVRYGLSALYLIGRPNVSRGAKLGLFVVGTPLAILLNLGLLAPTRYIALLRLRDNRWRTRQLDPNRTSVPRPAAARHPGEAGAV